MDRIILVTHANSNGQPVMIGPFSVEDAKTGQRKIIEKIEPGDATVVIAKLTSLEEYLKEEV